MSQKVELKIDWATHEAAKYACETWHYTKSVPVGKMVKLGVWEDGAFIGVVLYSCGSAGVGVIGKRLGLEPIHVAELARVALRSSHKTPVTRIVSITLKKLKEITPGLRLLVSYADPEQGHIGGIYQGGNWHYTGRSSPDVAYIDQDGRRWHSRSVSETGFKTRHGKKTRAPSPVGMKKIELEPKYRYLMPLDAEMRAQIAPLAKSYPKRAGSKDNVASGFQSEEGGVIPTPALQKTDGVA